MEKIKFVNACNQFFGKREGQTLLQFAQEIKQLTPKDREELAPLLGKALGAEVEA